MFARGDGVRVVDCQSAGMVGTVEGLSEFHPGWVWVTRVDGRRQRYLASQLVALVEVEAW